MAGVAYPKQEIPDDDMGGLILMFNKCIKPQIEKLKQDTAKVEETFETIINGQPDIDNGVVKWKYKIGHRANSITLCINQIKFSEFYILCFSNENKEDKYETIIRFGNLENFPSILSTAITQVRNLQK